jgi:hypothetical protein
MTPQQFIESRLMEAAHMPLALITQAEFKAGYKTWVGLTEVHRAYELVHDFGDKGCVVKAVQINPKPSGSGSCL